VCSFGLSGLGRIQRDPLICTLNDVRFFTKSAVIFFYFEEKQNIFDKPAPVLFKTEIFAAGGAMMNVLQLYNGFH
jgi:hypothetical protein